MTTPLSCDGARELVPEAALDVLDAAVRADVLAHVAGCARCRRELGELAAVADAMLLAAPPVDPPAGFEARVFERLGVAAPSSSRRRRLLPVLAAAAALVLGLGLGALLRGASSSSSPTYPLAARLVAPDGRAVGQVLISDHPDRMVCVLDDAPAGATYSVSIVAADTVADVGSFTAGPGWSWSARLPVEGASVRQIVLRDAAGAVRATARVPT